MSVPKNLVELIASAGFEIRPIRKKCAGFNLLEKVISPIKLRLAGAHGRHLPEPSDVLESLKAAGIEVKAVRAGYANPHKLEKATLFVERYREILSDPLNLLIERVPEAGYIDEHGCVILHNGHRVPLAGDLAYYDDFSDILILNRGVHEPLEEYCFQELMKIISVDKPVMLELGAYWAHYSMWLLKHFPNAQCFMVEPDKKNISCGENNLKINNYSGRFINEFVGVNGFKVDVFTKEQGIATLDILHSDIQGYELEMLDGASSFLAQHLAKYIFISTHSEKIHTGVVEKLKAFGYRIEVESGFSTHTTSCDGFVFASAPTVPQIFEQFKPLGRAEIAQAKPEKLLDSVSNIKRYQ